MPTSERICSIARAHRSLMAAWWRSEENYSLLNMRIDLWWTSLFSYAIDQSALPLMLLAVHALGTREHTYSNLNYTNNSIYQTHMRLHTYGVRAQFMQNVLECRTILGVWLGDKIDSCRETIDETLRKIIQSEAIMFMSFSRMFSAGK